MSSRSRKSPLAASGSPEAPAAGAWNEMLDARGAMKPYWADLSGVLRGWGAEDRRVLLEESARMLADVGTTFNVYRDVGGAGQPYELDPVPLLVDFTDWQEVSKGLIQRVRLLEAILEDLYGPQNLMRSGLIPPDLVHANPAFHENTRNVQAEGGHRLMATGCDLIRAPDGAWTVLQDHTHTPGGLGQTLENRTVASAVLPELFARSGVAKLRPFFEAERLALQGMVAKREGGNVVFLTPGYHHASYFEHAYKARLLGIPLVESADLTVRERRLFLKTLAGLRRVDGVVCRLQDEVLDPLEFWNSRGRGVPGLMEAWRSGNVALVNAPGSGFAESVALQPFLPRICREFFGEDLLLPFVECWWLGQQSVRERLARDMSSYLLLSAFGRDGLLPVRWSALSAAAKKQWQAEIESRPWDFVVQRDLAPGVVPSLQGQGLQSRPVVWRAFTLNCRDRPMVLAGGLARIGKAGEPPQFWPHHAGFTKDVWVTGMAASGNESELAQDILGERVSAASEVPSRIAEQLYWVGRYAERVELVTRMLRVTLRSLGGEPGKRQQVQVAACLKLMEGSGLMGDEVEEMGSVAELGNHVRRRDKRSSLVRLVGLLLANAAGARDRLSDDTWRFFNQLKAIVDGAEPVAKSSELARVLDRLVLHLAAFSGMQAENMIRGHGWRFLETGRRIERALNGVALLRSGAGDRAVLEPLLEVFDSVMTYRRRYFSRPEWDGVIHLVFFDGSNPRSVAHQLRVLKEQADLFPGDPEFGLLPRIRERVDELETRMASALLPGEAELTHMEEMLAGLSDFLTLHYFSHSVRRVF